MHETFPLSALVLIRFSRDVQESYAAFMWGNLFKPGSVFEERGAGLTGL